MPNKEMGRPLERRYPPRVDATPEEIAQAMFRGPPPKGPVVPRTYHCTACERAVYYPETLYRNGRCETCRSH